MSEHRLTWPIACAWCFGITLVLQLAVLMLMATSPGAVSNIVTLGMLELLVFLLGGSALIHVHYSPQNARGWSHALGVRPFGSVLVPLGAALGVTLNPVAESVRSWVELIWPTPAAELAARAEMLRHDTALQTISLFLMVALLVPLIEELFYRGALFSLLRQSYRAAFATAFVAFTFTLAHSAPRDWVSLLLVALPLTLLRLWAGNIWPSVFAHAAFNATTLVRWVNHSSLDEAPAIGLGLLFGSAASSGLLLVIARRLSPVTQAST
jgi:hypothetical protein